MLDGLPADEQYEVLAGVREHIHAALSERADVDVRSVLAELGPPDAVAREAYGSGPYAVHSPLPATPVKPPVADRHWVPAVVVLLQALGLPSLLLFASVASYVSPWVIFASGLRGLPFWIGVALLVGTSSLWTTGQKWAHLLLLPGSASLIGLAPEVGRLIAGEAGVNAAVLTALPLVIIGGGWLLARLTTAGRSQVRGQAAMEGARPFA